MGKTHAICELGDREFPQRFAYCDFQANLDALTAVFSGPIGVSRIVGDLLALLHMDIVEGQTLIALDEIQLCEPALNALRFFAQSGYRVIATGSQLGVTMHFQTNDTAAPLVARNDGSFFKVYLADTGLLYYRYNLAPEAFLSDALRPGLSAAFRGAITENCCMQALVANGVASYYWTPGTTARREVEFVMQDRLGRIVPLEVKSGENVSSTSLAAYWKKSRAKVARARLSCVTGRVGARVR